MPSFRDLVVVCDESARHPAMGGAITVDESTWHSIKRAFALPEYATVFCSATIRLEATHYNTGRPRTWRRVLEYLVRHLPTSTTRMSGDCFAVADTLCDGQEQAPPSSAAYSSCCLGQPRNKPLRQRMLPRGRLNELIFNSRRSHLRKRHLDAPGGDLMLQHL